jgi:hypothetical protein
MKTPVAVAALFSLALLTSCGSSGGGSTSIIPPVQAQSGYSTASISGTYSVLFHQYIFGAYIGSFKADGNGNITSGTLTWSNFGTTPYTCTGITFSGTYNLQSTAIGTASLTLTGPNVNSSCTSPSAQTSGSFIIQAGSDGASLLLLESDDPNATGLDGLNGLAGQATKQ